MGIITPDIPTPGGTTADEEPKIPDALNSILTLVNGGLENVNVSANAALDGAKLADTSVDTAQLADGAVETAKLGADSVTGAKIGDDQINSEHIASGAIDADHLAPGAALGGIADGSISPGKMDADYGVATRTTTRVITTTEGAIAQLVTPTLPAGSIWHIQANLSIYCVGNGGTVQFKMIYGIGTPIEPCGATLGFPANTSIVDSRNVPLSIVWQAPSDSVVQILCQKLSGTGTITVQGDYPAQSYMHWHRIG